MKLNYGEVFADAGEMWRRESGLLVPIAAVFFFLPSFAALLFLTVPDTTGLSDEALQKLVMTLFWERLPWILGQAVIKTLGVGAMLILLLDAANLSVGEALWRALGRLPGLVAARVIAFSGVLLGLLIFIVPGLYLMGRTLLTSPVYIAEPGRSPAQAAISGFERTSGNGWMLFFVIGTISAAQYLIGSVAERGMTAFASTGAVLVFPFALVLATVSALTTIAAVLVEVSAYRALAKQGM